MADSYSTDSNNDDDLDENSELDISSLLTKDNGPEHILEKYAKMDNIAEELDDYQRNMIAMRVVSSTNEDLQTMKIWLEQVDEAQRLAKLVREPKNTPLPQSASIKYPLITNACYQFHSRTYPELIQDGKLVKCAIIGQPNQDLLDAADRISAHMSYQLLYQDSEWEAGMDTLLIVLPNIGFVLKKTYYDPLKGRNCSDVISYKDMIIRNAPDIHVLSDLRRITQRLYCHQNDLVENAREGCYLEEAVEEIGAYYADNHMDPYCELLEQHTFIDLDEDGYAEPYVVTIHKDTMKLLRVKARFTKDNIEFTKKGKKVKRIEPIQYFTDYHLLPSPDGSFLSMGFGTLMLHLNETVNTILNQLIDAGTLATMQTGFMDSRIKMMGGQTMVDPGSWTRVKGVIGQTLKDGMLPLNYKEPSAVLYQLLGLLIQTAKDLTSSTDAMQGLQNATNVPATSMLASIEQGMKLFSSIQKRLYRALKSEYHKIFILNKMYLEPHEEFEIVGGQSMVTSDDYHNPSIRVIPIGDPNMASTTQRLAQAQVTMNLLDKPGVSNYEIMHGLLSAAQIPNIDAILPPANKDKIDNAPDPKMLEVQGKQQVAAANVQIKAKHQTMKENELAMKLAEAEAKITLMQANAVKSVADAKKTQHDGINQDMNLQLDTIKAHMNAATQAHQVNVNQDIANKNLDLQKQQMMNDQAETPDAGDAGTGGDVA